MGILIITILFMIILWFLYQTVIYVKKRKLIFDIVHNFNDSESSEGDDKMRKEGKKNKTFSTLSNEHFVADLVSDRNEIDFWVQDAENKISRMVIINDEKPPGGKIKDPEWCKNIALRLDNFFLSDTDQVEKSEENDRDVQDICDQLGGKICENISFKRVDIPENAGATFYTSTGIKLLPGFSYCLYKPPPVQHSDYQCDPDWGFWIFSPKYERWLCQSRVPGIYNAASDSFLDACKCGGVGGDREKKEDGVLLFDGEPLIGGNAAIKTRFKAEDFYSPDFQKRFSCRCPRGYIFDSSVSRTRCIKDKCLVGLPEFAAAPGLDPVTKQCRCGPHFFNIDSNLDMPCTGCPVNTPQYDAASNTLSVYMKCKKHRHDFGLYPCRTDEEKILGCTKIVIKVKPIYRRLKSKTSKNIDGGKDSLGDNEDHTLEDYSFEDRIFW